MCAFERAPIQARAPQGRAADEDARTRPWRSADTLAAAATLLTRSAPWTVAMLALRSHVVEAAVARFSWSARAPPSSGRSRSAIETGAQRRLGEHGGQRTIRQRLLLAGLAAWRLTLTLSTGTRRSSSRPLGVSHVVFASIRDTGVRGVRGGLRCSELSETAYRSYPTAKATR